LDWLGITIWAGVGVIARWALSLLGIEGDLEHYEKLPYGCEGFREVYVHSSGLRLHALPVGDMEYCHVRMSGSVAPCIPAERLRLKLQELVDGDYRWHCTRIDLTFDHDHFKPVDIYDAVSDGRVRSLAQRRTARRTYGIESDCDTVYFGARTSDRYLRTYAKEGRTRSELECKGGVPKLSC
jgi:hypothetical protein